MQNIEPDPRIFAAAHLTETNELTDESALLLDYITRLESLKLLLRLPIPDMKGFIPTIPQTNSTTTLNRINDQIFKAGDIEIHIQRQHYQHTLRFKVPFTDAGALTTEQFESSYVQKYVECFPTLQNHLRELFLSHPPASFQLNRKSDDEVLISVELLATLYNVIKEPLECSLELKKNENVSNAIKFVKTKSTEFSGGSENDFKRAEGELNGNGAASSSTTFMGLAAQPDVVIGYWFPFKNRSRVLIGVTGVGELKVPNLDISACYTALKEITNMNQIASKLHYKNPRFRNCNKTKVIRFEEIVTKTVTISVHCGCPKIIISDGTNFLLIHMNSLFEDVEGDLGKKHKTLERVKLKQAERKRKREGRPSAVPVQTYLKKGNHILTTLQHKPLQHFVNQSH